MTKRDEGFRFIYRRGAYMWLHPNLVEPRDIDCTDMDDAEFETFVRKHP